MMRVRVNKMMRMNKMIKVRMIKVRMIKVRMMRVNDENE